jgi:hypothetical protein
LIKKGFIRKHKPIVIIENWLFTICLYFIIFTSILFLRDVIFEVFGIHGGIWVETPSNFVDIHQLFGFFLILVAILHIAAHSTGTNKDILSKDPIKDFKMFLHSIFYLIGFSKFEEPGGGDKYYSRQKIVYLSLAYTIGLSAMSGVILFLISSSSEIRGMFILTHIAAGVSIILILVFHLAINIRRHDLTALYCSFISGKLPLWHIKKHHKIWYYKILAHEKRRFKGKAFRVKYKTSDPVARAIIKFYGIENINLEKTAILDLTKQFKKKNNPNDINRFVELSKVL